MPEPIYTWLLYRDVSLQTNGILLLNLAVSENWNMASSSLHAFNWRPVGSLWAVLHFKHSAAINHVVFRTPLRQSQRGVVTQDRSLSSAPNLCQRKMITGIALGLSHVYYCLYLKRLLGASDTCWYSKRERQWETDRGWVVVWGNLILTCLYDCHVHAIKISHTEESAGKAR